MSLAAVSPSVRSLFAIALLAWAVCLPHPAAMADRWPIPDDGQRKVAAREVADAYEVELEAARKGKPQPLAKLLLDESEKTDVPARAFAMLEIAERLAVEAGGVAQTMEVIDRRAERFETDGLADRVAVLDRLVKARPAKPRDQKPKPTPDDSDSALFDAAIDTTDRAIGADRLDLAGAALDVARTLVTGSAAEAGLEDRAKRIGDRRTQALAVEQAMQALQDNPDDAEARTVVGLDACFARTDWATGLEHLARTTNPAVKALADEELRCRSLLALPPDEAFDLANGWWKMADEGSFPTYADAMRRRSRELYRQVVDELTDPVERRTAVRRIAAADPAGDGTTPPPPPPDPPATKPLRGLDGRAKAAELAAALGGGADTEAAVDRALKWIVEHQLPDGGWSFDLAACPGCGGRCSHSGVSKAKDRCGATAMALLPLLGRGYTHREGKYKAAVDKGITFLSRLALAEQGKLYRESGSLYSHGLGTAALCECYAMTKDRRIQMPARMAVEYLAAAQDPRGGGWRYAPKQPGDTSATGWQVMALKTASLAGFTTNPLAIRKVGEFLDSVAVENGSRYGYTDNSRASPGLTAVGLLCRLHLGWKKDRPAVQSGVQYLAKTGPTSDLYYDYYATQVMRCVEGDAWTAWNTQMKKLLLESQADEAHEAGSWHDRVDGGHGADAAGRLYCTSLATLMLESYYRSILP